MTDRSHRFRWWPAIAGAALYAMLIAPPATAEITDATRFLDQTESLRIKDHGQFIQRLAQIHRESPALTPAQQWQLRYLDAYESSLEGKYPQAEPTLRDVIKHSDDPTLAAKASGLLLSNLAVAHRYQEAFTLAHQLTIALPTIRDPLARYSTLSNLSQMLNLAGQTELAVQYAREMEKTLPQGVSPCGARFRLQAALYNARRLTSANAELRQTIDLCLDAGQPIIATATQLILSTLYLEERQPAKALALLDRIAPRIKRNQYFPHALSAQAQRAQAYEQLGRYDDAQKAALAAVAMASADDIDNFLKDAYEVLYRIAERRGDTASALSYYKHYVAQDKGYLNDLSAQVLAYQTVQQQVLTRTMEASALARQNRILKLQQALDKRAVETSRLQISLLVVTLTAIALLLLRTKRSQMRFKSMATRDGLTGILNHQNFVVEAGRQLDQLEKKSGQACLAWIDLDHFKLINDNHGHAAGDAALRHVVTLCQQQLRPDDLFGRLGGEEFGLMLGCPRDQAMSIANRIRKAIEETPLEWNDQMLKISASVGLASTHRIGFDLQRLCREADSALYRAKRAGRNCVIADDGDDDAPRDIDLPT